MRNAFINITRKKFQVGTDFTRTQGLLYFGFGITALVGPLLVGILFDTTGSYLTTGFLALAALGLLGAFVLLLVNHVIYTSDDSK